MGTGQLKGPLVLQVEMGWMRRCQSKFLEGLSLGHFDRESAGLIAITNICAQHFRRLAENEGEHLAQLHMRLEDTGSAESKGEEVE